MSQKAGVLFPTIPLRNSGPAETSAFKNLDPPPAALIGEISRIILMQMIPAIIEEDIISFGEAMTSVDFMFGEFWIGIQGGRFTHPLIEEGIGFLTENGALGVGQSSWGPAFYGLSEGETQAQKGCAELERYLNEDERKGRAFVARPDNHGAIVTKTGI
jgi:beta-RFAP synthase